MSHQPGKLWKCQANGESQSWFLEWSPARRNKRVVLVLDNSDSMCEPLRQVEAIARNIGDNLGARGTCELWRLGEVRPRSTFRKEKVGGRGGLISQAGELLASNNTAGSWGVDTLTAIMDPDFRDDTIFEQLVVVLVTDGEIFDIESIPQAITSFPGFGWIRLGKRKSRQCSWLTEARIPIQNSEHSIRRHLVLQPMSTRLEFGPGIHKVKSCDNCGVLLEDDAREVLSGADWMGAFFTGESCPSPYLEYALDGKIVRNTEVVLQESPLPLCFQTTAKILTASDQPQWDFSLLQKIVHRLQRKDIGESEEKKYCCTQCGGFFGLTDLLSTPACRCGQLRLCSKPVKASKYMNRSLVFPLSGSMVQDGPREMALRPNILDFHLEENAVEPSLIISLR